MPDSTNNNPDPTLGILGKLPLPIREQIYRYVLVRPFGRIRPIMNGDFSINFSRGPWLYSGGGGTILELPMELISAPYAHCVDNDPLDYNPGVIAATFVFCSLLDCSILRTSKQVFFEANHILLRDSKILWQDDFWRMRSYSLTGNAKLIEERKRAIFTTCRYLAIEMWMPLEDEYRRILRERTNLRVIRFFLGSLPDFLYGHRHDTKEQIGDDTKVHLVQYFHGIRACATVSINGLGAEYVDAFHHPDKRVARANARALLNEIERVMLKRCRCDKDDKGRHEEDVRFGRVFEGNLMF